VKLKEREIRVLVVGLDNAGKTTIVKKISGESIDEIAPTLGFNISTLALNGFQLNVWDVGGQKTLRTFWRNYFEKTDVLVWVVDSTDLKRLRDCKVELMDILKEEKLAGASLLVFANKQDVIGAMTAEEIATALDLTTTCSSSDNNINSDNSSSVGSISGMTKKRRWRVQRCSAVSGEGVLSGFEFITSDVGSRMFLLD
jgi:ADP-ribosylation factor-like protein 2